MSAKLQRLSLLPSYLKEPKLTRPSKSIEKVKTMLSDHENDSFSDHVSKLMIQLQVKEPSNATTYPHP